MINVLNISLSPTATVKDALKLIDDGAVKIALIVDQQKHLLGTLSDGDIRRGLLRKKTLNDTIEDIYFKSPICANENDSKEILLNLSAKHKVNQIPIINDNKQIIGLFVLDDNLSTKQHENTVVLMVGGLGTRLRPLTENTPKPMLEVGGKPILLTIVEGFAKSGFTNITMCLGYKSNVIQDFFQDGSKFGVEIEYIEEDKEMGTVGALTLLKQKPKEAFFVMNGDLLTNFNYEQMLEFHESIYKENYQIHFLASDTKNDISNFTGNDGYDFAFLMESINSNENTLRDWYDRVVQVVIIPDTENNYYFYDQKHREQMRIIQINTNFWNMINYFHQ